MGRSRTARICLNRRMWTITPRYWSPAARTAAVVAILVLVPLVAGVLPVLVGWVKPDRALSSAAPIAAASVATISLVLTAFSTMSGWARTKRAATIEAYHRWNSDTIEYRKTVFRLIGDQALSPDQGRALVDRRPLPDIVLANGQQDQDLLAECIRSTLNGLERIAVGCDMGVFDPTTLRRLGGTTVARCFVRWEEYVKHRRTAQNGEEKFKNAFVELEDLVHRFQSHAAKAESRQIDLEWIAARSRRR